MRHKEKTNTMPGNGDDTKMKCEVLFYVSGVAAVSWNPCTERHSVGRSDVSILTDSNSGCHSRVSD